MLIEEYGISRITLRKVLETLKEERIIESKQGSGWFVCNKSIIRYIPVIIPRDSSGYRMTEISEGAYDFFGGTGFYPLLRFTDADAQREREIIDGLINDGHKNFIIYPVNYRKNISFYHRILRKGCNCLFIDSVPNEFMCDCVAIKSGKNPEGNVIAKPCSNIRVFDCHSTDGHGNFDRQ